MSDRITVKAVVTIQVKVPLDQPWNGEERATNILAAARREAEGMIVWVGHNKDAARAYSSAIKVVALTVEEEK